MSSSGSYDGLKGISRSFTNRHQSGIKIFVSNLRFEWYQSDWNPTKNDGTVLENVCVGDWVLVISRVNNGREYPTSNHAWTLQTV